MQIGQTLEQILEILAFDGGLTDFYVDAEKNQAQTLDNFIITKNRKLKTRPGSTVNNTAHARLTTRVHSLFSFDSIFWRVDQTNLKYDNGSSITTLLGPSSNSCFYYADSGSYSIPQSWADFVFIQEAGHTSSTMSRPVMLFKDNSATYKLRTLGLPPVATGSVTISPASAGAHSYVYAFVHKYTATVNGGAQYIFQSAPGYIAWKTTNAIDNVNYTTITVPTYTNAADENFSTNMVVDVYRTTDGGNTYYRVAADKAMGATFNDTTTDASLTALTSLYVNGGVLPNDLPPRCKAMHATTQYGYFGCIDTNSTTEQSVVLQSKNGAPWAVPATNRIILDDAFVAVSSYRDIPIVFGNKYVYRIDGVFDDSGRGAGIAIKISYNTGCISAGSVVQTKSGVLFAGSDGFYFTDGYQVEKISETLPTTYASATDTTAKCNRIRGAYDELNRLVYWAMDLNSNGENDSLLVFHEWLGVQPTGVFTKWKGATYGGVNNLNPTSLWVSGGKLYRHESSGYLLKHSDSVYTDPLIETGKAATSWDLQTIIWRFKTPSLSFGSSSIRKWVTSVGLSAQDDTNSTIQAACSTDNQTTEQNLGEIYVKNKTTWGDPLITWGDPLLWTSTSGIPAVKRKCKAGKLRCTYKAFSFTNSKSVIVSSAKNNEKAQLNVVLAGASNSKTATIPNVTSYTWPSDVVGMVLTTVQDGYAKEFAVTSRDSDTQITISDPGLDLAEGMTFSKLVEKVTVRGPATVTGAGPTKNVTLDLAATYDWPTNVIGYVISFASDNYVSEYTITGRTSGDVITITDSSGTAPTTSQHWRIKGYFKGDALHLLSLSMFFIPMTDSQTPYQGVGGVDA